MEALLCLQTCSELPDSKVISRFLVLFCLFVALLAMEREKSDSDQSRYTVWLSHFSALSTPEQNNNRQKRQMRLPPLYFRMFLTMI